MEVSSVADRAADDGALAIDGVTKQTERNGPLAPVQGSHGRACAYVNGEAACFGRFTTDVARGAVADGREDLRLPQPGERGGLSGRAFGKAAEFARSDSARFAKFV